MTGLDECELACFICTSASQKVADDLIAQILYYLNDYKLRTYAIYQKRIANALNEAPQYTPGAIWLTQEIAGLEKTDADTIRRTETEFGMKMRTKNTAQSRRETERKKDR
jgi:hypothetical protein